ncbi:uncharacterized protein LOC135394533 isoform X2 [Ornithodoros turicata]|uniref:uncharacterized protein LOC135394533 isoform X2 n=1 Tax=Ornithodoros turicata TaxID=34597 RepID=UPI0031393A7E
MLRFLFLTSLCSARSVPHFSHEERDTYQDQTDDLFNYTFGYGKTQLPYTGESGIRIPLNPDTGKSGYGTVCAKDEDCSSSLGLACTFNGGNGDAKCGCARGTPIFITDNIGIAKCVQAKRLYESCMSDLECNQNDENMQCVDFLCYCPRPYVLASNQRCIPGKASPAAVFYSALPTLVLLLTLLVLGAGYSYQRLHRASDQEKSHSGRRDSPVDHESRAHSGALVCFSPYRARNSSAFQCCIDPRQRYYEMYGEYASWGYAKVPKHPPRYIRHSEENRVNSAGSSFLGVDGSRETEKRKELAVTAVAPVHQALTTQTPRSHNEVSICVPPRYKPGVTGCGKTSRERRPNQRLLAAIKRSSSGQIPHPKELKAFLNARDVVINVEPIASVKDVDWTLESGAACAAASSMKQSAHSNSRCEDTDSRAAISSGSITEGENASLGAASLSQDQTIAMSEEFTPTYWTDSQNISSTTLLLDHLGGTMPFGSFAEQKQPLDMGHPSKPHSATFCLRQAKSMNFICESLGSTGSRHAFGHVLTGRRRVLSSNDVSMLIGESIETDIDSTSKHEAESDISKSNAGASVDGAPSKPGKGEKNEMWSISQDGQNSHTRTPLQTVSGRQGDRRVLITPQARHGAPGTKKTVNQYGTELVVNARSETSLCKSSESFPPEMEIIQPHSVLKYTFVSHLPPEHTGELSVEDMSVIRSRLCKTPPQLMSSGFDIFSSIDTNLTEEPSCFHMNINSNVGFQEYLDNNWPDALSRKSLGYRPQTPCTLECQTGELLTNSSVEVAHSTRKTSPNEKFRHALRLNETACSLKLLPRKVARQISAEAERSATMRPSQTLATTSDREDNQAYNKEEVIQRCSSMLSCNEGGEPTASRSAPVIATESISDGESDVAPRIKSPLCLCHVPTCLPEPHWTDDLLGTCRNHFITTQAESGSWILSEQRNTGRSDKSKSADTSTQTHITGQLIRSLEEQTFNRANFIDLVSIGNQHYAREHRSIMPGLASQVLDETEYAKKIIFGNLAAGFIGMPYMRPGEDTLSPVGPLKLQDLIIRKHPILKVVLQLHNGNISQTTMPIIESIVQTEASHDALPHEDTALSGGGVPGRIDHSDQSPTKRVTFQRASSCALTDCHESSMLKEPLHSKYTGDGHTAPHSQEQVTRDVHPQAVLSSASIQDETCFESMYDAALQSESGTLVKIVTERLNSGERDQDEIARTVSSCGETSTSFHVSDTEVMKASFGDRSTPRMARYGPQDSREDACEAWAIQVAVSDSALHRDNPISFGSSSQWPSDENSSGADGRI